MAPVQDACSAVVIGGHVATRPEQLAALLADEPALLAAGNSTQLFGFDHRWPHSAGDSASQARNLNRYCTVTFHSIVET